MAVLPIGVRLFAGAGLDVGNAGRLDGAHLLYTNSADVREQPLAVTEQDRDDVELELIDQPRGEVLLDDVGASADHHILAGRGPLGLIERGLDPLGHEDEGGASLHLQGLPRMVGEHEDRGVEGRVVAPPAVPGRVVAPRAGPAPEHVPAHHRRPDVRQRLLDHGRADIDFATIQAMLLAPRLELDDPLVEIFAAHAERVLLALVRAGDVSVQRNRDVEPELAHGKALLSFGSLRDGRSRCHPLWRPRPPSELIARSSRVRLKPRVNLFPWRTRKRSVTAALEEESGVSGPPSFGPLPVSYVPEAGARSGCLRPISRSTTSVVPVSHESLSGGETCRAGSTASSRSWPS